MDNRPPADDWLRTKKDSERTSPGTQRTDESNSGSVS